MKRAAQSPARSRPRKKAAAPASAPSASAPSAAPTAPEAPAPARNVDPLEGAVSVAAGLLFVVAALFPRSLRQLLMLALGGGLLHRGLTGHCAVYQAAGIDTAPASLRPPSGE